MPYKQLAILAFIFVISAAFKYSAELLSTGAPASSTGAPGEFGCNVTGCHDDKPLNAGNAGISFAFDGGNSEFIPGNTYDLSLSIQENGVNRFGFELLALNDLDQTNSGVFIITDSNRTQQIPGLNGLANRRYVTYTYNGTTPNFADESVWDLRWQAPSASTGPVTFYFGLLSANNDGTDHGDYTYISSVTITPQPVGISNISVLENVIVYPNPVVSKCSISYELQDEAWVNVAVFDHSGRFINTLCDNKQAKGSQYLTWDQFVGEPGIYLIVIKINDRMVVKRILVNHE